MAADVRSAVFRYDRRSLNETQYYPATILRPSSIPEWNDAVVVDIEGIGETTVLQSALMLAPPYAPAATPEGGDDRGR